MTIRTFIEKAAEGGWDETAMRLRMRPEAASRDLPMEIVLLDPEAWKAVGKVEGWPDASVNKHGVMKHQRLSGEFNWYGNMHRLIDALAEGKSVEEYLATI